MTMWHMPDDGLVWFGPVSMTMELYMDLPKHQRDRVLVDAFLARPAMLDAKINTPDKEC